MIHQHWPFDSDAGAAAAIQVGLRIRRCPGPRPLAAAPSEPLRFVRAHHFHVRARLVHCRYLPVNGVRSPDADRTAPKLPSLSDWLIGIEARALSPGASTVTASTF